MSEEIQKDKHDLQSDGIPVVDDTATNEQPELQLAERKRAEQTIALLNFALNNVREAAFLIDEKARFHFVNEESCRVLGYSREELMGLGVPDVDPDFTMDRWPSHWVELKANRAMVFEGRHRRKDGHIVPVEINANYIEYGGKSYNLALVRDITERKLAEEERQSNLLFYKGMDRVNRAIQGAGNLETMMSDVLDEVLDIFSCDRASLVFPCDPDSPTWKVPMERFRPEYPGVFALGTEMAMTPEVADMHRASLDSEHPVAFGMGTDLPLPPQVQSYGDKSGLGMALRPKLGKPWGFSLLQCSRVREWTDAEKRLFEAIGRRMTDGLTSLLSYKDLQQSEEKYRRIVDTSNEGIWVLDSDVRTTFVNERMTEILGYAEEEILGRPFTDFIFDTDNADHQQRMRNRRAGLSETYERRFRRKDGGEIWTLVSATPVFGAEGSFKGSFGMFTDITKRKQAEQELLEERKLFVGGCNVAFRWKAAEGWPVEYVSPNIVDQFGYEPEVFTGGKISYAAIIHPDDLARVAVEVENHSRKGVPFFEQDYRIRHANGEFRWIYDFTAVIRDSTGKITHYQGYITDITGRKRADEALIESERKYREIFDNVLDGVYILEVTGDGRFRTIDVNSALERLTGIPRTFSIGKTQEETVPADVAEIVNRKYRHCVEAGHPIEEEAKLDLPSGTRYFHSTLIPIRDGTGRIYRIIGISRDITDRKQSEELLHRLNRELRAISNCNQMLMRAEDEPTLLNEICRIICEDAGYLLAWVGYAEHDATRTIRPVAWAGKDSGYIADVKLTWAEDSEQGNGPAGIAIRTGNSVVVQDFTIDARMAPWREGALQRGYRSGIALPLKDENGIVFGVLLIYSGEANAISEEEIRLLDELAGDLAFGITSIRTRTERKEAEQALQESERQYRELMKNLPVGVVVHNPDTTIRYWNEVALKLLGLTADQISGRNAFDPSWHFTDNKGNRMHPDLYPANLVANERRMIRDSVVGIIHAGTTAPVWVYVNAFPEFNSQGDLQQIVVTFVDFSQRKSLEEDLRKLNETLEQRVAEEVGRNREKDHILIQQSRLAAMGEMVHNIAHQWRQPLNAISLILSNIQDDYDYQELTKESLQESISQAHGILQQMSTTIDDFRNFFRPDRTPEEFDIHKSVSDALSIIDASFRDNHIRTATSLEKGLRAFGFSSQFSQALLNILTNAEEAIQNRNISDGQIELHLERVGNIGVLTIQDNGGGIPEGVLSRIFDPYFSTKPQGSGIGLYMSRMIVERNLKGTIRAENFGEGVRITISLPLVSANGTGPIQT